MPRFAPQLATMVLAFSLSGCASTLFTLAPDDGSKVYVGTRVDAGLIGEWSQGSSVPGLHFLIPLCFLDLPLSLVTDTVYLPYTLGREAVR